VGPQKGLVCYVWRLRTWASWDLTQLGPRLEVWDAALCPLPCEAWPGLAEGPKGAFMGRSNPYLRMRKSSLLCRRDIRPMQPFWHYCGHCIACRPPGLPAELRCMAKGMIRARERGSQSPLEQLNIEARLAAVRMICHKAWLHLQYSTAAPERIHRPRSAAVVFHGRQLFVCGAWCQ